MTTYIICPVPIVIAAVILTPPCFLAIGFTYGMKVGMRNFKIRAELLWQYLDNIDTLSDIAKGNLEYFYTQTGRIVKKRFDLAYSDGYSLVWKRIKKKEENADGNRA